MAVPGQTFKRQIILHTCLNVVPGIRRLFCVLRLSVVSLCEC